MRQTWRVSTAGRVAGLVGTAFGLVVVVRALLAIARDGMELGLAYGLLLGVALVVAPLVLTLRPAVTLTETDVDVRNPLRTLRVPIAEITDAKTGYGGVRIETRAGRAVTAWAVQKSNLANWRGQHTRADDVAEAIRQAARPRARR
ncbi:PH (Pleckstrin Homology) domain-containing protein [Asanoa ferruginea]|uniref:PH (Pleckstrin Homology) domain-containing protein n=1 Tax=Asanoa ferruginea TaxID=53367 RepID=A0A3D9ZG41_9ACTN|nr:PH domain-containing protein [Asanoa ferruginea]REF95809.1 PH (Pleckstrin Homology) domain-containing protein [Asanoa ferruginea]